MEMDRDGLVTGTKGEEKEIKDYYDYYYYYKKKKKIFCGLNRSAVGALLAGGLLIVSECMLYKRNLFHFSGKCDLMAMYTQTCSLD